MILFYIIVLGLIVWAARARDPDARTKEFLGKDQTTIVNGIFILLVFIRHAMGYLSVAGYQFSSFSDRAGQYLTALIGQLVVSTFLAFSGYGVMESIKIRGSEYVDSMPRKRILRTLLMFDFAVIIYLVLSWGLGIRISPQKLVSALVAWDSLGNSNWYIFCILCCYAIAWLASKICSCAEARTLMISLGCVSYVLFVLACGKEFWWCNTVFAFVFGVVVSSYKDLVVKLLQRYYSVMLIVAFFMACGIQLLEKTLEGVMSGVVLYNLKSVIFVALIVLCMWSVRLKNSILKWCGINLFLLYIYQRVPMLVFSTKYEGLMLRYPLIFIFSSLLITCGGVLLYRKLGEMICKDRVG